MQRSTGREVVARAQLAPLAFSLSWPLGGYGDGGACFTRDAELAQRIRRISRHGQSRRYFHSDGVNGRIDTLQAAIVLAKFSVFEEEVKARGKIGESFSAKLQAAGIKRTPVVFAVIPALCSIYYCS